ncbi:RNA-directed RNA polymerase [Clarias magur]|uniref:RNA-directed RNA polymerase n=1 Tax=Clarias magur TaxID=1594786 RepID=A0A8J4WZE2_CLAMG|nr:RNA-directed RNA polymerase [Clarias magur]
MEDWRGGSQKGQEEHMAAPWCSVCRPKCISSYFTFTSEPRLSKTAARTRTCSQTLIQSVATKNIQYE